MFAVADELVEGISFLCGSSADTFVGIDINQFLADAVFQQLFVVDILGSEGVKLIVLVRTDTDVCGSTGFLFAYGKRCDGDDLLLHLLSPFCFVSTKYTTTNSKVQSKTSLICRSNNKFAIMF